MPGKELDQLLPKDAAARLLAFRNAIIRALPGAVQDVMLFGSRARGDGQPDSDYDVAVLLSGDLAEDRDVRRQISDAAWEHAIDGYPINPVAIPADALAPAGGARTELAARIAAEGVRVR